MNNPLLTTLEIVACLGVESCAASELQARFGISVATLKRHLAEARTLGARIDSVKSAQGSRYHLANLHEIKSRLDRWIELEKTRDLTL